MESIFVDDGLIVDEREPEDRRKIVWLALLIIGAVLLIAAIAAMIIPLFTSNKKAEADPLAVLSPSCDTQVNNAITMLEQSCLSLGLDEVCYGNNTLKARLINQTPAQFDARGDVIPVAVMQDLQAAPLNTKTGEWGIAVFKTRAVLPRTVPG